LPAFCETVFLEPGKLSYFLQKSKADGRYWRNGVVEEWSPKEGILEEWNDGRMKN
jgi:hypothetical protein